MDLFKLISFKASRMQTKIPQAPSRIPQQPQVAMQYLQVPQVEQASSRIPRTQFTSNVPQTVINRPQTASRIPQMPTRLPQMSSNRPQTLTRIPQIFVNQPELSHRPMTHQTQIHSVQQPSQVPRSPTRIPQGPISQIPASRIPTTTTQLRADIEQYKSKLGMNLRQPEAASNIPRSIPQRIMQDNNKQVEANLKISESIGNIRKVRVRPVNEAACKFCVLSDCIFQKFDNS
jgi:5-methylcytosine-specific restriction endonuclease McrA